MRKGLLDVLPKNALEDLTAEDFRLLVNGCGEVNVQMLISFTSFNDESGELLSHDLLLWLLRELWNGRFCWHISQGNIYASLTGENADKLLQFKRWFWSIVEKMSMTERQDLVSLLSVALFFQYTFGKTNWFIEIHHIQTLVMYNIFRKRDTETKLSWLSLSTLVWFWNQKCELISPCSRCTSGPQALPCQPVRRASNRCPPSPSGHRTTSTFPQPILAFHVFTCHFIRQSRYWNKNSC